MYPFEVFYKNKKMKEGFNLLILLVICVCSFFIYGDAIPINLMELRNCITARELLTVEDWLLPTMNGEYRLAKPPFPTWLTAMAGMTVGDMHNLAALRFPAAVMASLMVFFIYFFGKMLFQNRQTAFVSAVVFATSYLVISVGRANSWDVYCHSFMMGAITVLWRIFRERKADWWLFVTGGGLLGLSFFSKGPIAFYSLLLPFLGAYMFVFSCPKNMRSKVYQWLILLSIFMIISAFWPLYVYFNLPAEGMQTAQTEVAAWSNRNTRPIWYYLTFPLEMGIWVFGLLVMLWVPYVQKYVVKQWAAYRFLLIWLLGAVVLLSLVPEKKERYLFPALVPMALLVGQYVQYLIDAAKNKALRRMDAVFLGVSVVVWGLLMLVAMGVFAFLVEKAVTLQLLLFLVLGLFVISCLIYTYWKKKLFIFFMNGVLIVALLLCFYLPNLQKFSSFQSKEPLVEAVAEFPKLKAYDWYHIGKDIPFGLLWDSQRAIPKWDYKADCKLLQELPIVLFCTEEVIDLVMINCVVDFRIQQVFMFGEWRVLLLEDEDIIYDR